MEGTGATNHVRRLISWVTRTRAREEDDRRRELTLHWILLASIMLALLEAGQRLPAVIRGGVGAADHGRTFALSCLADLAFGAPLVMSRVGRQVVAAWGLLCVYYAVAAYLLFAEGPEEPAALVLCSMLVVAAGVLLGTREAIVAVLLITATLIGSSAAATGSDVPGVAELLPIAGGMGVLALILSARTAERQDSAQTLLTGRDDDSAALPSGLLAKLTVRELQVVRLVAEGLSNAEIARELFVSPRTVERHVSNVLRKTGRTNRTEIAILAIGDGFAAPTQNYP